VRWICQKVMAMKNLTRTADCPTSKVTKTEQRKDVDNGLKK
jgi:hypothetical protein